jgi:hypothetical protein
MNEKKLKTILDNHIKWLNDKGGKRADLSYANLTNADLRGADLINANLIGVNLSNANLKGADLNGANLRDANLFGANLSYANLRGADLRGADLIGANLRDANLIGANLICANLKVANLSNATLNGANLRGADLRDARNLETVSYDENTSMFALNCPEKGGFTAFKKLRNNIIAELYIPARAKRSSATTRKCRASEAKVVKMWNYITKETVTKATSQHDESFVYETGKTVKPTKPFNEDRWNECASGIHFFMTQEEAENY